MTKATEKMWKARRDHIMNEVLPAIFGTMLGIILFPIIWPVKTVYRYVDDTFYVTAEDIVIGCLIIIAIGSFTALITWAIWSDRDTTPERLKTFMSQSVCRNNSVVQYLKDNPTLTISNERLSRFKTQCKADDLREDMAKNDSDFGTHPSSTPRPKVY